MNIIIKKKKNIFLDYKKSLINNETESNQEEISNDSQLNSSKIKLKRDMTDYNVSLMNYENSYSSFFWVFSDDSDFFSVNLFTYI